MSFISLWAGRIEPPGTLSTHLAALYRMLNHSTFSRDSGVCAEREQVPIAELLEPFRLGDVNLSEAIAVAERQGLRFVGVYTHHSPKAEAIEGCGLRFVGTFPDAQP